FLYHITLSSEMANLAQTMPKTYWCGFRVVLLLGLITAVSAYTVGAILAGVAFHSWNYDDISKT
ncbi:hypothetical protein Avbf_08003, partial [Armadillidium vulgare]